MIVPEHIECDICGIAKGAANHWLLAVLPAEDYPVPGIAFGRLDSPIDGPGIRKKHLCGEACAHKLLAQFLESLYRKDRHAPATHHAE